LKAYIKERTLDYLNKKEKDWHYYKTVEAHRTFLYTMSLYKHLRYGSNNLKNQN